jgi:hypothetical protein
MYCGLYFNSIGLTITREIACIIVRSMFVLLCDQVYLGCHSQDIVLVNVRLSFINFVKQEV